MQTSRIKRLAASAFDVRADVLVQTHGPDAHIAVVGGDVSFWQFYRHTREHKAANGLEQRQPPTPHPRANLPFPTSGSP